MNPVERLEVAAYTIPTDKPESDGTLEWDSTTIAVVHAHGGGERGLGYTYGHAATATLIEATLREVVVGRDAFAIPASGRHSPNACGTSVGRESLRPRSPPSTQRSGT